MTLNQLLQFIDLEDKRLTKYYRKSSPKERILSRAVKLAEEYGELCEEVLSSVGDQRKDKLVKVDKDNLPKEFAEVIIVTLLLAKSLNVDVKQALKDTIEIINNRKDY